MVCVASISIEAQNVTFLDPVADAYVRDDTYASENFGADEKLTVKNIATEPGNNRNAYLKFDLSEIQGEVLFAKVKLTIRYIGLDSVINSVALISDDSWDEGIITWNNAPTGDSITSWMMMIEQRYTQIEFDVTSSVQNRTEGDDALSIMVNSPYDQGGSGGIDYYSKENTDSILYNPVLEVAWEDAVAVQDARVNKFTIYPNPASDHITINELPSNKSFNAQIYNMTGMLIKQREVNSDNAIIDINDLTPGLYFLNVPGYLLEAQKFIKQ